MDMEIVIDGVRDLMRRHDFATPTALARAVGVPQPTIARLFYRTHETVRLETLQALAVYFRVTVSQLTGELPLEPDEQIAHVQQVMQTLPEYKKAAIVAAVDKLAEDEIGRTTESTPSSASSAQSSVRLRQPRQALVPTKRGGRRKQA